tara:strand:- start:1268 stop:1489 length:222 start_codon:yes stop_codon:yes gene_type:complete
MTLAGYFTVEAIVGDESHTINVPDYILTDAIEDGLTVRGVVIEVQEFLANKILSTEDFYLTRKTLDKIIEKAA